MGISSMPAPSEGVLTLLVVNTAMTMSILKQITQSLLHFFGLAASADDRADPPPELSRVLFPAEEPGLKEMFRSRIKPTESLVNRLPCGHLFHQSCVERWFDYRNTTCPLCRSQLFPAADSSSAPG